MNRAATGDLTRIADLVDGIAALPRWDLIERWAGHYGNPPPKSISTRLLVLAIAYATQVECNGGLSRRCQKELLRLAGLADKQLESPPIPDGPVPTRHKTSIWPRARPRAGTRFIREWNGKSHVVEVLDEGFAWQGRTYGSLSAIASLITGSRWSGPRFFGLT